MCVCVCVCVFLLLLLLQGFGEGGFVWVVMRPVLYEE
jgi:hypothetical protein